ncbi:MAG: DUF362 domain-containing protein [Candidatus Aminicenantes bacterium]|nr:MAG: DUF362 domain-containing protein [Candidatus Aminicenantes bacterium]
MSKDNTSALSRREFIKGSVIGLASLPTLSYGSLVEKEEAEKAKIVLFRTQDRKEGVREVLKFLDFPSVRGKRVLLKPNFNTADPAPGSTHNDTLSQLIQEIDKRGASEMAIGERSGPPATQSVLEDKGIFELAKKLDTKIINFEDLEEKDWVQFNPQGNHWNNGFYIPRPVVESDYVVSTCCLKTHQYGGVFTLSIKLAVGLTPKSLMSELHNQRRNAMRKMIAEINLGYKPQLIVLDGVEAFVDGGPMTGTKKTANVFLAGRDRIAIDAVGIAILKDLGSNEAIMGRKIFEQEQIARAVELSLGISSPDQIEFITPDEASREYAKKLRSVLLQG